MTPEGKVKQKIKDFLKSLSGCWFFCPYSAGFGAVGIPDIIGCYKGKFFAIEVKAPGKLDNVTLMQRKSIDSINTCGGIAFVADDIETVRTHVLFKTA